jgi:hypothetical protein
MTDGITPQTIDLTSWITLYIKFLKQQCRITDVLNLLRHKVPRPGGIKVVFMSLNGNMYSKYLQQYLLYSTNKFIHITLNVWY